MTTKDERIDTWLRDAHAMEKQAEQMLTAQASRIENYPDLKARIEEHLNETKRQAEQVERCLEARGASRSSLKDAGGKMTAMFQGIGGAMTGDEVIKGVMASYAFEHMEVAAYKILVAAAEAEGDRETARVCGEICREEEAMAAWLADHFSAITKAHLSRAEAGASEAKR